MSCLRPKIIQNPGSIVCKCVQCPKKDPERQVPYIDISSGVFQSLKNLYHRESWTHHHNGETEDRLKGQTLYLANLKPNML